MTAQSPPEFEQLMREFREHHTRLRSLLGPADVEAPAVMTAASTADLIREIDEIGAHLLVADEELRVQSEELASAQSNLTDVVSAYERLFTDAPVPYLQTDLDGVIVRNNRAAAQLIEGTLAGTTRTLPGLVRLADRGAVRDLLSRVRAESAGHSAGQERGPRPIEVHLEQSGRTVPVVVSAQLIAPGESAMVHWELRPGPPPQASAPRAGSGIALVTAMTAAIRDLASTTDLASMANHIAAAGHTLVPGVTGTGLALRRARDRIETASASDLDARLVTDLQRSLREGPALDALRTGTVIRTDSLTTDARWPRLAAHHGELAVSSVLAVPLIGPRGPFGALACYSRQSAGFGSDAEAIAASLATQAALIYAARELEGNLRSGMETRERIGQAVGVLMERHRLTAQQAFDLLVYVSQRTHRKLREIASWVTETGEDPHDFLKSAAVADLPRV